MFSLYYILLLQVLASGWGYFNSNKDIASHLMYVYLDVIDEFECKERVNKRYKHWLHENNFCTWSSGKDTCNGRYQQVFC